MSGLLALSDLKLKLSKGDGLGPWTPAAVAHPYVGQAAGSVRQWLVGESVYPTFTTHTTDTSTATTSVSANIGSPANGDVVIVVHRAASTTTISFPGGWTTPIGTITDATDSAQSAYRVCDGTEGATITITQGTSLRAATVAFKFTGAGTPLFAYYPGVNAQVGSEAATQDPLTGGPQPGICNFFLVVATWPGGQEAITAAPSGYFGFTDHFNTGAGGAGAAHVSWAWKREVSNYDVPNAWTFPDTIAGGVDTIIYGWVIPPA